MSFVVRREDPGRTIEMAALLFDGGGAAYGSSGHQVAPYDGNSAIFKDRFICAGQYIPVERPGVFHDLSCAFT